MSRGRTGRPPISAGGTKGSLLVVRVSAEEKARLETAAEKAGAALSAWVRETLLAAAKLAERRGRGDDRGHE